jgi:starch synthase
MGCDPTILQRFFPDLGTARYPQMYQRSGFDSDQSASPQRAEMRARFIAGRYRIAIITHGAFHVLDLARELHALGHSVTVYSVLPTRRIAAKGIPSRCYRNLLPYLFPLAALARRGPKSCQRRFDRIFQLAVDSMAAAVLGPCDVLIGMSGMCVASLKTARRRFGAKIFLERASRHILSQKEILDAIPNSGGEAIPEFLIKRELWAYEFADVISIPSRHAEDSFLERGVPPSKLFRNPYGADLEVFYSTFAPNLDCPTVIYTGTWSLQKGCDLLWEACQRARAWKLLHVGLVGDASVPVSSYFEHVEPVLQHRLPEYYARANVAVLPSRQDGFGLVMAQAVACGLPIVCSDMTGGPDLREMLDNCEEIHIVPTGDSRALSMGIQRALGQAANQRGKRNFLGAIRERLSWRAYGRRYSAEIERRLEHS